MDDNFCPRRLLNKPLKKLSKADTSVIPTFLQCYTECLFPKSLQLWSEQIKFSRKYQTSILYWNESSIILFSIIICFQRTLQSFQSSSRVLLFFSPWPLFRSHFCYSDDISSVYAVLFMKLILNYIEIINSQHIFRYTSLDDVNRCVWLIDVENFRRFICWC